MRFESHDQTWQETHLDLRFRPVTLETMDGFTRFRSTHPSFASCSCMRWRARNADFQRATTADRASAFDALVEKGVPVGILAYLDDSPVGWCSVAPRETFHGLKSSRNEDTRLWAVTCFFVDPLYRKNGVSVRLLKAAVEYARSQGAKVIEGYPAESGHGPRSSAGSFSTFRKAGFRDVLASGRKTRVMRNVVG